MRWMFLPLQRYVQFNGRSRRMEFWMYMLLLALVQLVFLLLMVIMIAVMSASMRGGESGAYEGLFGFFASIGILLVLEGLIALGTFLPTLAVQVRRLHDSDRSGWWVMLFWGPWLLSWVTAVLSAASGEQAIAYLSIFAWVAYLIGLIVLIVFYCLPGTPGNNRYGPDPLGSTVDLAATFQ